MHEESRREPPRIYRNLGIGLTIAYAVGLFVYFLFERPEFLAMTPNEFGDFLAGSLGPLAILWLVLGFWQQGDELRSSVDALKMQSEELRHSVEQQRNLVEATRRQIEIDESVIESESMRREQREMPRLHIDGGGNLARSGMPGREYSFNILNIGEVCTEVRASWGSDHIKSGHSETPILNQQERLAITMRTFENDSEADIDISVVCIDINGIPREFIFNLKKRGALIERSHALGKLVVK